MPKKYRFVLILISFLILFGIIWYANPALLISYLSTSNLGYVALGLLASSLALFFRVLKWRVLLDGVGFLELVPVQLFGMAISNFTPGKAAEPTKAIVLKLKRGLDVSKTLPSVIWERVMDIIIIVLISLLAIPFLGIRANFYLISLFSIGVFICLIVLLLIILYSKRVGLFVFGLLKKIPFLRGISSGFMDAFYQARISKTKLVLCLIITIIPWVLDGFVIYFSMLALGFELSIFVAIGISALAVLIGIASFLPGGIGSAETVGVLLLGLVGAAPALATAGIFLARFLSFWFSVVLGGLSFIYLSKKIDLKGLKI